MGDSDLIQIGELAKRSDVNIQTIRYYERRGLMKPKRIKDSGYRLYDSSAIRAIKFVKQSQELGFSLDEIKGLMKLRSPSKASCGKVKIQAVRKLNDVREKISQLKKIEKSILALVDSCEEGQVTETCPIITALEA